MSTGLPITDYLHVDQERQAEQRTPSDRRTSLYALTIIDHPDPARIGEHVVLRGLSEGRAQPIGRIEPLFAHHGQDHGRPLEVPYLSRKPIILEPVDQGVRLDLSDSRTPVRVDGFSLSDSCGFTRASLARGAVIELSRHVALLMHHGLQRPATRSREHTCLGHSPLMDEVEREIVRLAETWSTVLCCGEFGTEKELVARLIHQRSGRGGPFVATSLASMTEDDMAHHLIGDPVEGYGDGGSFGRADEGTLFIDDIDRAPVALQEIIVTLLKTGTLPGADGPRLSNARLLAGTAADASIVRDGKHVPSLLHSLGNVLSIPPLRDRREDIARLFLGFVRDTLSRANRGDILRFRGWRVEPWLPRGFMARLTLYRWPGNAEQLYNVADQLVADSLGRPRAHITPTLERMF